MPGSGSGTCSTARCSRALSPQPAPVADVGSGAGLPGIPLALARPDLRCILVEPLLRRATFLDEVVDRLGLGNVEVVRAGPRSCTGAWTADVVTARAVAPLDRLAGWCLPLVAPDGAMLALKGDRAAPSWPPGAGPAAARAASWSVEEHGAGLVDPPSVVRIVPTGRPVASRVANDHGSVIVGGRPR